MDQDEGDVFLAEDVNNGRTSRRRVAAEIAPPSLCFWCKREGECQIVQPNQTSPDNGDESVTGKLGCSFLKCWKIFNYPLKPGPVTNSRGLEVRLAFGSSWHEVEKH